MKAFPQYKFDDLFYFTPESPFESTRQASEKFTSATEYMPITPRATPVLS
jgi:hypothetical protein